MYRYLVPLLVVAALPITSSGAEGQGKPWLDLQNCSICKSMGENMDMMKHVKWDVYKISNGMLSVAVIPKEHQAKMEECHKKMQQVITRLEKGEHLPLCAMCESYGELMQAGAKQEEIKTDFGMIGLMTANDAEVVKKIQAHADRTAKEMEEYKKAQSN